MIGRQGCQRFPGLHAVAARPRLGVLQVTCQRTVESLQQPVEQVDRVRTIHKSISRQYNSVEAAASAQSNSPAQKIPSTTSGSVTRTQ